MTNRELRFALGQVLAIEGTAQPGLTPQIAFNVGDTPGTGRGMIIVKHCLQLHGGKTAFESKEVHGTSFVVALPIFAVADEDSTATAQLFHKVATGQKLDARSVKAVRPSLIERRRVRGFHIRPKVKNPSRGLTFSPAVGEVTRVSIKDGDKIPSASLQLLAGSSGDSLSRTRTGNSMEKGGTNGLENCR